MNTIQKALELQEIYAAWQGDEPADAMEITSDYLTTILDGGLPRMIRAENDTGKVVNVIQLRLDYANLAATNSEAKRIAEIKTEAGKIIEAVLPDWKQRNALARMVELSDAKQTRSLTTEEQAEIDSITQIWSWIKLVRAASDAAELDGRQAYQILWPALPA
jgi:hypothetical protein